MQFQFSQNRRISKRLPLDSDTNDVNEKITKQVSWRETAYKDSIQRVMRLVWNVLQIYPFLDPKKNVFWGIVSICAVTHNPNVFLMKCCFQGPKLIVFVAVSPIHGCWCKLSVKTKYRPWSCNKRRILSWADPN